METRRCSRKFCFSSPDEKRTSSSSFLSSSLLSLVLVVVGHLRTRGVPRGALGSYEARYRVRTKRVEVLFSLETRRWFSEILLLVPRREEDLLLLLRPRTPPPLLSLVLVVVGQLRTRSEVLQEEHLVAMRLATGREDERASSGGRCPSRLETRR